MNAFYQCLMLHAPKKMYYRNYRLLALPSILLHRGVSYCNASTYRCTVTPLVVCIDEIIIGERFGCSSFANGGQGSLTGLGSAVD